MSDGQVFAFVVVAIVGIVLARLFNMGSDEAWGDCWEREMRRRERTRERDRHTVLARQRK